MKSGQKLLNFNFKEENVLSHSSPNLLIKIYLLARREKICWYRDLNERGSMKEKKASSSQLPLFSFEKLSKHGEVLIWQIFDNSKLNLDCGRKKTYLIIVTDPRARPVEKKSVMWRNFKFLYMKHVEKVKITPHLD